MAGLSSICFSALWPSWAISTLRPWARSAFDSAKMLRMSSSTISTVRPPSEASTARTGGAAAGFSECRNRLTSSSSRSGEREPLMTIESVY